MGTCAPRRSGLPVPRRRTLAAGILPFARSVHSPLRHPGSRRMQTPAPGARAAPRSGARRSARRCAATRPRVFKVAAGVPRGRRFSTCGSPTPAVFLVQVKNLHPRAVTRQRNVPSATRADRAAQSHLGCDRGCPQGCRGHGWPGSRAVTRQRNVPSATRADRAAQSHLGCDRGCPQGCRGHGWPGSRAVTRQRNVQPALPLRPACPGRRAPPRAGRRARRRPSSPSSSPRARAVSAPSSPRRPASPRP